MHIACSLHSLALTKLLLAQVGVDRSIENMKEKTPAEIVDDEIAAREGFVQSESVKKTLERLRELRVML